MMRGCRFAEANLAIIFRNRARTGKKPYLCSLENVSENSIRHTFVKTVELLAPARDLESAMAAVDYGADAVYIGGSKFGARRGACNPVEEVARAVEYAHQYGVRIHATLNTLLFDDELAEAEAEARAAQEGKSNE